MKRVVFAISVLFSVFLTMHAQVSKLSPFVRGAMMAEGKKQKTDINPLTRTGSLPAGEGGGRGPITAFVRTTDIPALRSEGCQIYAQWDDICIASIPLDKISKLASMPSVQRIEAGRSCMVGPDPSPAFPREGVGKSHSSLSMYNRNSNSLNSHQLPPPPTGSLPMGEGGGRGRKK